MRYTEKCGHKISEMTLGTVQLGRPYGINNTKGMPSYEESATILKTALDLGITTFDTANNYEKSEEILGRFFSGTTAEKTIVTKIEFSDEGKSELENSIITQVEECKRKLCLDKIPFVMLHSDIYIERYGKTIIEIFQKLKENGLVDGIGVSFGRKQFLQEYLDNDVFDIIQIAANMFDCREFKSGIISEISNRGIAVCVRSVYLQGLFFKDTNSLPPALKCAVPYLDKLHKLAGDLHVPVAQLALSYINQQQGIASLVLGAETPEQVINSASLFGAPPLSSEIIDKIDEISEGIPEVVITPGLWGNW